MKLLFTTLCIFIAAGGFSQTTEVTYVPYAKSNEFVFCDETGKQVIDSSFDYAEPFYRNYAIVANNGKYGVIDKKGKVIVPLQYRNVKYSVDKKQKAPANPDGIYFTVNFSKIKFGNSDEVNYNYLGKKIPNEQISSTEYGSSYQSYTIFMKEGKYGCKEGADTIIPPLYLELQAIPYSNLLIAKKAQDSVGIITRDNSVCVPFIYKSIVLNNQDELLFRVYTDVNDYCFLYFNDVIHNQYKTYCTYKTINTVLEKRYALVHDNGTMFYLDLLTGKELKL